MCATQLYIGVMSGTSLDGVDVALVDLSEAACQLVATHFLPYDDSTKQALLDLHVPNHNELEQTALMSNQLAKLYAKAINDLLTAQALSPSHIQAIGCHGQTIRHRPELGFTLQIGNNAYLAELCKIRVVGDFRSRDIAAHGQGAPLVPAFHRAVFGSTTQNRVIINIGGIANITYLPHSDKVLGFDSGPGNLLLDAWTQLHTGQPYDANGDWARLGTIQPALLDALYACPYFSLTAPKSTGRDLFNLKWLQQYIPDQVTYTPQDVAQTLTRLTALSIAQSIAQSCPATDEIYTCGGGAHNGLLMQHLQQLLPEIAIHKTNALGIDVDWVEAVAFAWLAKQTLTNQPGNLPEVTGAEGPRVLGAIYPA